MFFLEALLLLSEPAQTATNARAGGGGGRDNAVEISKCNEKPGRKGNRREIEAHKPMG